jgi:hypothetical protein
MVSSFLDLFPSSRETNHLNQSPNAMKAVLGVFFFFFLSVPLEAKQWCEILIPAAHPKKHVYKLKGCQIGGNLKTIGPHVMGQFVVDLNGITSGIESFDLVLRNHYLDLKTRRYAALRIYPFDVGDKTFKALLRFNGNTRVISVKILSVSKKHLDAYFSLNLDDFAFKSGQGWELIGHKIEIHARIFPNESKKRRSTFPK